eukprot:9115774-Alexandrium_andersonii.AAC.1
MPWQHQGADRSALGGAERRTMSAGERQGARAPRAPRRQAGAVLRQRRPRGRGHQRAPGHA